MDRYGKLYLIPNLLAEGSSNISIAPGIVEIVNSLEHFIVENEKTARRHLRSIGFTQPFDQVKLFPIGKHSDPTNYDEYLTVALEGKDLGVFSEAGLPGIADPGAQIISKAHRKNIQVVPLPGPSSIIMALIASGMNGQKFSFHGYLPIEKGERIKKLQFLEKSVSGFGSQIFMETPFRNNQLLDEVIRSCNPNSLLSIACDITSEHELIRTKLVKQWAKDKPDLHKRPTVFVLG